MMTATNVVFPEKALKRLAWRMKGVADSKGGPLSYCQILDEICLGVWGKRYPEAQVVALPRDEAPAPLVRVIEYGSDVLVAHEGRYVTGSFAGTDMECPTEHLEATARTLADISGGTCRWSVMPRLVSELDTEDVLELARALGYFALREPLIEALARHQRARLRDTNCQVVLSESVPEPLRDDGTKGVVQDLETRVERELSSTGGSVVDALLGGEVWAVNFDGHREYRFTLGDLGRAGMLRGDIWRIVESRTGEQLDVILSGANADSESSD